MDDRSRCLVQVTLKLRVGFAPCMVTCDRLRGGARVIRKPMKTQSQMVCVYEELRPCTDGKLDYMISEVASFIRLVIYSSKGVFRYDRD